MIEKPNGIVTFTTDFGIRDPYAGILKGIVLGANPDVRLVDITHDVPPHDIMNGAFTLMRSCPYFPDGTIHVVVIDPGVGGRRKNIAVRTGRYYYIGPDNGVFSYVLENEKECEIREIKNEPFLFKNVSNTFHGRDVFAPCAGQLAAGKPFEEIGPEVKRIKHLKMSKPQRDGHVMTGEIISVDSFGNLISNVSEKQLQSFVGNSKYEIFYATERFTEVSRRYGDVEPGDPLTLFSSCGYLEVSMNGGSAAAYFMTAAGTTVTIRKY